MLTRTVGWDRHTDRQEPALIHGTAQHRQGVRCLSDCGIRCWRRYVGAFVGLRVCIVVALAGSASGKQNVSRSLFHFRFRVVWSRILSRCGRSGTRPSSGKRAVTRLRICEADSDSLCANPVNATCTAAAGDIS